MAIPDNPITRKEHFLAKAAGESVNTPDPITREEMYLDAIASGSGGGGGGDNRFVVTLTPTNPDYSGTMDKTMGQIRAAYNAGKEIWLALGDQAGLVSFSNGLGTERVGFWAYIILTANNWLVVVRADHDDDQVNTYNVTIYKLTPMGS